jgi:hypothetical protein
MTMTEAITNEQQVSSSSDIELVPHVKSQSETHSVVGRSESNILSFGSACDIDSRLKRTKRQDHRKQYLVSWEKDPAAFYSSYSYDILGVRHDKPICWLYKRSAENSNAITLGCRLCEQYRMTKNKNGKENTWATKGFNVMALDKIKDHRLSEKHREAEQLEIQRTSMAQPDWVTTQSTVLSRQQEAVQNMMFCCVHLCQNDQSLNSFSHLCDLLERVGVKLLPAQISGVSYRNDNSALTFVQHMSSVLHTDLVSKLKRSPVLGNFLNRRFNVASKYDFLFCRMDDG